MYADSFKREVIECYEGGGVTMAQVADKFGISEATVGVWVELNKVGQLYIKRRKGAPTGNRNARKFSDGDIARIVRMYTVDDMGVSDIATRFGVAPITIKQYLEREGVYRGWSGPRGRKRKMTPEVERGIISDYRDNGMTSRELASKYDVAVGTINAFLYRSGTTNPRGKWQRASSRLSQISQAVIADYKTGLFSHKNLADRYGVSTRTISRILDDAGVEAIGSIRVVSADVVARVRSDVLSELASGMDRFDVAVRYNIPLGTVDRICGGREDGQGVPDVVSDKVVALHEGGKKMSEIAVELGVSRYIVRKSLVERGIDTRMVKAGSTSRGTKASRMGEGILAMHSDGRKPSDIAQELGISYTTVRKVLKEAGVWKVKRQTGERQVERKGTKSGRMGGETLRLHQELGLSAPTVKKALSSAGSHEEPAAAAAPADSGGDVHGGPGPELFVVRLVTSVWRRLGDVEAVAAETGVGVEMVEAILRNEVGV